MSTSTGMEVTALSREEILAARQQLGDRVMRTPLHEWHGPLLEERMGTQARVFLKLELFQFTGSFKPRGALLNMLALTPEQLARGVTAVSAGNHAIAVAYAARALGASAKVVMIASANPRRIELCRQYGATIEMAETAHAAFERAKRIEEAEGRSFIHPFEGRTTAIGTATVGLEFCEQVESLEAVIVPIGGGGLAAGVASAVKLWQPTCAVYGVEPTGADSMYRSFHAGEPRAIERVTTIADSLGAPYALPVSFELCRRNIQEVVLVSDDELRASMRVLRLDCKLAVEPAGAAAMAALLGPLCERLQGRRVGLIVCGANIDTETYIKYLGTSP
jgi:threonine dehydratase